MIGSILKETEHMNYSFLASDRYFMFFCQNHLKEKGRNYFLVVAGWYSASLCVSAYLFRLYEF